MLNIHSDLVQKEMAVIGPNAFCVLLAISSHISPLKRDCFPSRARLRAITGLGPETIRSAVRKLSELGYLKMNQPQLSDGKFGRTTYTVLTPMIGIYVPVNQLEVEDEKPGGSKPYAAEPSTAEPHTAKVPLSISKEEIISKSEGIRPANAEPPTPPELPQTLKEKKNAKYGDGRAAASRVVAHLNERAMRSFEIGDKMPKSVLGFITGRLNEGYTEEQLKAVIDNRCSNWLGDAKMSEFLRPKTLFNATNFVNYLEEATRAGTGAPTKSLLDVPLNDEKRYNVWIEKMKAYPKTNAEVRFFRASEFNGFFAERPDWFPMIWSKWEPGLLQKKFKAALTALEDCPTKSKLAPDGLCSYLKQWFIDERDGKH